MARSTSLRKNYAWCIWVGFQLICFALFLHPMSPEKFLLLAMTAPLDTLSESFGLGMALLFWVSVCLTTIGALGWIGPGRIFKTRRLIRLRSLSKWEPAK